MDYRSLFDAVRRRPGMYLDGVSYAEAAAFVLGVDAGNAWGLLHGFNEWLAVNFDGATNLAWSALILRITFPNTPTAWQSSDLTTEQQKAAFDMLFRLLDDFLTQRAPGGIHLQTIFEQYAALLKRREAEEDS